MSPEGEVVVNELLGLSPQTRAEQSRAAGNERVLVKGGKDGKTHVCACSITNVVSGLDHWLLLLMLMMADECCAVVLGDSPRIDRAPPKQFSGYPSEKQEWASNNGNMKAETKRKKDGERVR